MDTKVTITIDRMNGAAFDEPASEVGRILRELATRIENTSWKDAKATLRAYRTNCAYPVKAARGRELNPDYQAAVTSRNKEKSCR